MRRKKEVVALTTLQESEQNDSSALALRPDLAETARDYAKASRSEATQKAFRADWKVFSDWCNEQGVRALPASVDTAIAFFSDQAKTKKVATLARYKATLGKMHKLKNFPSPFSDDRFKLVLDGIRRTHKVKQSRKAAATLDMVSSPPATGDLESIRNRAVMLLGFVTSCRRSEVASLDVKDLTFVPEGLIVHLEKSKVDQEGEGRFIPVPLSEEEPDRCAVAAVRTWLSASGIKEGPLFQSMRAGSLTGRRLPPKAVADIVKDAARTSGEDPKKYAGHSLRAGFITWAYEAGFSVAEIMAQSGHTKVETVMRYVRTSTQVNPFKRSKITAMMEAIRKMSDRK